MSIISLTKLTVLKRTKNSTYKWRIYSWFVRFDLVQIVFIIDIFVANHAVLDCYFAKISNI